MSVPDYVLYTAKPVHARHNALPFGQSFWCLRGSQDMNESSQGGLGYDAVCDCLKSQARGDWMACVDCDGGGTPSPGRGPAKGGRPNTALVGTAIGRVWAWEGRASGGVRMLPKAELRAMT